MAESSYQSLNQCLTAAQHKTHLIQKMADKPSEILKPHAEHLKALLSKVHPVAALNNMHCINIYIKPEDFF